VEIRVLSPTGTLGAGFKIDSLRRGVARRPHVIACDAGSTDSGPAALGSGTPKFSRDACQRDLRLLLEARQTLGVPLIIGSCGTSGRDVGVDWMAAILREIAAEASMTVRVACIKADQSSGYVMQRWSEGRIVPLIPAPPITPAVIETSHMVGMMGTEPIAAALQDGAQVVLAGRASDAALFAVVPELAGADTGAAWHAAKILECGAACAVVPAADALVAYVRDGHFDVEPLDPSARCTPLSVAAHTLYENSNPFLLTEPSGVIDTTDTTYLAVSERRVRVCGSQFTPAARYSIKLEGARQAGFQTIAVGGVRDPQIIASLHELLPRARAYFDDRIADLFDGRVAPDSYDIDYRLYGQDAVLGALEPMRGASIHEVGILITVTASTQDVATKIATLVCHASAHLPIPGYHGLVSTIAYPFSPPEIERGPVYRFTLNHVCLPDDPLEMFRIEVVGVGR
jgi:Acyclic terpene utilisation family protein AtuA